MLVAKNSLIVDFPSQPRKLSKTSVVCSSSPCVSFSPSHETKYVGSKSPGDRKAAWYSKKEQKSFQNEIVNEAHQLRQVIRTADQPKDILKSRKYELVGIEIRLSQELARAVAKNRIEHESDVLDEYNRQKVEGMMDAEALAQVSAKTSRRSEMMARHFAFHNWNI